MTPIRGWAPRGRKLVARAPFGKWRTLTFIAALRHDRTDAPYVLDAFPPHQCANYLRNSGYAST